MYQCTCRSNQLSDVGSYDVEYDYSSIGREVDPNLLVNNAQRSIERYAPLLPVRDVAAFPPMQVGDTPLCPAPRLGETLGLRHFYVKDDGRNPSGSLKDRASAIAVAMAQENQYPVVAAASTGNAAAALACQGASANQATVIFVPKTAPQAKIAQLVVYGSEVLVLDATYDEAFDLCTVSCQQFGWFNRNTGFNPYMTEGKKTVSFEIANQLARIGQSTSGTRYFVPPDAVFVSAGDGCILGGVHKGFRDLLALGWIDRIPRLYGVQSLGSSALANAWRNGNEFPQPVQATTLADSISVGAPRDPIKALNAVRETRGAFITVSDEAIIAAILPLARLSGIFGEPAGAAALAGVQQAVCDGLVTADERIVMINTGNGLKDVRAVMESAAEIEPIQASFDSVCVELDKRGLM